MTDEELNAIEGALKAIGDGTGVGVSIDLPKALSIIALARDGLKWRAMQPRPISEAPTDGTAFLAYTQDLRGLGLPPFWSFCAWHSDAGFCTDELREPTHFIPLSALPKPEVDPVSIVPEMVWTWDGKQYGYSAAPKPEVK